MSVYITRKRSVGRDRGVVQSGLRLTISFLPQASRTAAIQHAYRKAAASNPRDDAPKAGEIRSLGLLDKDEDSKAFLAKK